MELNATSATLLGFLVDGPRTGWELVEAVEASVGNFWNVTRSQVYRELPRLADAGLVTAGTAGPRERRPYRITAGGHRAFVSWLAEGPPPEARRIPLLLTTFFGAHLPPARFAEVLDECAADADAALARFVEVEPLVTEPFQRATLRFGQAYARLVQRWIEEEARPLLDGGQSLRATPTGQDTPVPPRPQ